MSEKNFCGHCVEATLLVNPRAFSNNSIRWVNLLEQGVPTLCPSCGVIYSVAKVISNSPSLSSDLRNTAGAVCGLLLLFAGMNFLDDLTS